MYKIKKTPNSEVKHKKILQHNDKLKQSGGGGETSKNCPKLIKNKKTDVGVGNSVPPVSIAVERNALSHRQGEDSVTCIRRRRAATQLTTILHVPGPPLISVACRWWRRQPFCVGVPGAWNSVSRDPGNRRESRALVGVAIISGRHWRAGYPP